MSSFGSSKSFGSSVSSGASAGSGSGSGSSSSGCPCDPDVSTYYVEFTNDGESPLYITLTGSLCDGYFTETGEVAPGFFFSLLWTGTEWLFSDGLNQNDFLAADGRCDPTGYYQYGNTWTAIISATPLP
jgi:hypothetical protein